MASPRHAIPQLKDVETLLLVPVVAQRTSLPECTASSCIQRTSVPVGLNKITEGLRYACEATLNTSSTPAMECEHQHATNVSSNAFLLGI